MARELSPGLVHFEGRGAPGLGLQRRPLTVQRDEALGAALPNAVFLEHVSELRFCLIILQWVSSSSHCPPEPPSVHSPATDACDMDLSALTMQGL